MIAMHVRKGLQIDSAQVSGFPQETSLRTRAGLVPVDPKALEELSPGPSSLLPHAFSHLSERGERQGSDDPQAMVSFPGSLLSLKVCRFITSSVLTMVGG